jgi:hypothetical protein
VLAVEDTLKLASDAVSTGDAALDVRSLAGIVVEALTQKKVTEADRTGLESLPEPFRAIVRNCLGQNGRSQWSAADLASWLRTQKGTEPKTVTHAAQAGTRKISLTSSVVALLLALVAVITIGSLWRNRHPAAAPPASQTPTPVVGSPAPVASPPQQPPPPAQVLAEPIQPAAKVPELKRQRATAAALPADVVRQALPEIPAKARRTIRGKATVLVKVVANENGEVTDAVAEPGSSRYFSHLATDAARKWRFASSGDASRKYLVRFEITRGETKTSVERSAE